MLPKSAALRVQHDAHPAMSTANRNAIKTFLKAVWKRSTETGWPVDAFAIGAELFAEDQDAARQQTLRLANECQKLCFFNMASEGAIHSISDAARAFIGLASTTEGRV
jgi:hypothetical protein